MAEGPATACVCVLFYGADEYCYKLAQRVLNRPMRELARHHVDFRFGCNAVGPETREFVRTQIATYFPNAFLIDSPNNAHKYPLMRQLFKVAPITAPITIWFDDDSCLAPDNVPEQWLPRLQKQLESHAMVGSIYRGRFVGAQIDWIKAQSWYAGKEPQTYVQFASGSWWAMQTAVINEFDLPRPEFKHRGVDMMFGELCRQHNLALCHFRDGVWINANDAGIEAAASKRGQQEQPIGFDYSHEVIC